MTADVTALTERLDALEATARAATPGPWEVEAYRDGRAWVNRSDGEALFALHGYGDDAAHIAAVDPAAVLRLVEGVREVLALHRCEVRTNRWGDEFTWCWECEATAPCPTMRALGRMLGVDG